MADQNESLGETQGLSALDKLARMGAVVSAPRRNYSKVILEEGYIDPEVMAEAVTLDKEDRQRWLNGSIEPVVDVTNGLVHEETGVVVLPPEDAQQIASVLETVATELFVKAEEVAASYETPLNENDPRFDVIDNLLGYEPEHMRMAMAESYAPMTLDKLQSINAKMLEEFGPPDGFNRMDQLADAAITAALDDPKRLELLKEFEVGRANHLRLLARLHDMIDPTSDMKTLMTPEYHQRSRDALEDSFLLKKALKEFLVSTKMVSPDRLDSTRGLLSGLNFIFSHYRANEDKLRSFIKLAKEEQHGKERAERFARESREVLEKGREEFLARLKALQDSMIPTGTKVLIGQRYKRLYLCDKNYARKVFAAKEEGAGLSKIKHGKVVSYTDLIWLSDPDCAMKFDSAEKARRMLEMTLDVIYSQTRADQVMVGGVGLDEISIVAPFMVHLNQDLKLA